MDRPAGIVDFTPSPEHFPFESRWFESSVGAVHYIDEGQGRPLVLFHGNPDWSFLYRKIVIALRGHYRCIAMDYPGFGLSAHPAAYGYTSREHADVCAELISSLDLEDMIVMGRTGADRSACPSRAGTTNASAGWSVCRRRDL
ncbi:MAG: alpha/beta fold hydrolase [Chloroflexi bacterium]|nr:alpha/beta fold hydrolase [Chloroflexota bacterium]MDA1003251.1 alpha/beta fold hydrolase [Chloroflexota bacterium]